MSRRTRRRQAGRLGALVLILTLAVAGLAVWSYAGAGPARKPVDVVLPKGGGVRQIASVLKDAGAIRSQTVFLVAARATGAAGRLKAGEYEFPAGASMARVLSDIAAGRFVRRFVVVPEGWTSGMAADAVRATPLLEGDVEAPPEGSLLPDGYQYQRGEQRGDVLARMMKARDELLAQMWAGRSPDLPLKTPEEAVTLASIVEKETGVPAERPRIAAVFENRLRMGMKLESDPTIIYGISQGRALGRGITASELQAPTPYNTYKIAGLPPTPIANPGRASLAAVLNPPKSDEFYFVADGSGGHVFASTYAAHEANVAKWRAIERARAAAGAGR